MTDELLTLDDIAAMYRCSRRHARDVITKRPAFPIHAPGTTQRHPLWLKEDMEKYLRRKPVFELNPA